MIDSYTSANFSAKADANGDVKITDPAVPNGGSVEQGPAAPFNGTASIFRTSRSVAQTTLAYTENRAAPATR